MKITQRLVDAALAVADENRDGDTPPSGAVRELVRAADAYQQLDGRPEPSRYGRAFDDIAEQWATLEAGHDLVHPDRSQCGGVGACPTMRLAYDLRQAMTEWLNEWRLRDDPQAAGR